MSWRVKILPLPDWSSLQLRFADLFILRGAPGEMAMFAKGRSGDHETEIYVTGPDILVIEALSPGGWQDAQAPAGDDVSLLVGNDDAWTHFGINCPIERF